MDKIRKIVYPLHAVMLLPQLFLYRISKRKNIIDEDVKAYVKHHKLHRYGLDGIRALIYLLAYTKFFRNQFYYRVGKPSKLLFTYPKSNLLKITADRIGKGLVFHHPDGTIINGGIIGDNCIIRQGVTIGNNGYDQAKRPVIGDHVEIFPGALIAGGITIGDHVKIGANAVVLKSVPSNSVVRAPEPIVNSLLD